MTEDAFKPECYVCVSESNSELLANVCKCTDRYIHIDCQKRLMLECTNGDNCSVCLSKYNNACIVSHERIIYRRLLIQCAVGAVFIVSTISIVMMLTALYTGMTRKHQRIVVNYNHTEHKNATAVHVYEWCAQLCTDANCTSGFVISDVRGEHCMLNLVENGSRSFIPYNVIFFVSFVACVTVGVKLYRRFILNRPFRETIKAVKFYSESEIASATQSE